MAKKLAALFLLCALMLTACAPAEEGEKTDPEFEVKLPPVVAGVNPYTGQVDETYNESARPALVIVLSGIEETLPQRGLSSADMVIEVATDGGRTQCLAVYKDAADVPNVGPVRVGMQYHIKLIEAANPVNIFVTAYNAFYRDAAQPSAYKYYTNGGLIKSAVKADGESLAQTQPPAQQFSFVPVGEAPRNLFNGDANAVKIKFTQDLYCEFFYDEQTKQYVKYQDGAPVIDKNNGKPLAFDNLLILNGLAVEAQDGTPEVYYEQGGFGCYLWGGSYEYVDWKFQNGRFYIVDAFGFAKNVLINPGRTYVAFSSDGLSTDPYVL